MPEISVIVPVYKVEQYLDRCVQSLLAQTFSDFEIILVDDGSPDSCPQKCDAWAEKDERIRVVHQKNGGVSAARNAGLAACRGKYISFADPDDWLESQMLAYLYNLLCTHPEAQIAQCEMLICKDEAPIVRQPPEEIRIFDQKDMLDYFFRVHGEASNVSVCNKLYEREILRDFSFVLTLNEDVEANYDFFQRADKMVVSNQRYYHYFVNQAGVTNSQFREENLVYLDVWDRIVARTEQEHPEYVKYAIINRKRANFTMLVKMRLRGYDKQNETLRRAYRTLKQQVRADFRTLMGWHMPLSRKLLLIWVCL